MNFKFRKKTTKKNKTNKQKNLTQEYFLSMKAPKNISFRKNLGE